jgi:elongation factor G
MKNKDRRVLRNIGIGAHIDAGKTTLTERILYFTGVIHRMGEVHDGNTIMDFMEEERDRGITIQAAATQTDWTWGEQDYSLNIIDTPGHVDFTIEVERSLRVLDGLVVLFSAVHGVEPQSETVWRQANRHKVPRIAFINKMDLPGAYYEAVIEQMEKRLGCTPLLLQIPIGEEEFFEGLVDLVHMKAMVWDGEAYSTIAIPSELMEEAGKARLAMLEQLAEYDEAIFLKIFDEPENITTADIESAIRQTTITQQLIPVMLGSAYKNKGVQPLLDAICAYFPAPEDLGTISGKHPHTGKDVSLERNDEAPFTALVFKIALDAQHRKMAFFRVYSGQAQFGQQMLNTNTGHKERLINLYRLNGEKRIKVEELQAGDIAAMANVKNINTGDTLCSPKHPVVLENIITPEPVISMVVEAKTSQDLDKLEVALQQLEAEDPSMHVIEDEDSGKTLISGMGELHLDVLAHRLRDEFKVEVNLGKPEVNYKEMLTQSIDFSYEYERQLPEPLQAAISINIGPADPDFLESDTFKSGKKTLQFESELPPKALPPIYVEHIERSFQWMMLSGVIAGLPLHSMKVVLKGAQVFEHSNELAFDLCTRNTYRRAAPKTAPILIEPIMSLEINCPEEHIGKIMGDLNRRRGQPQGMEPRVGYSIIRAQAPLAELFGYAAKIRTLSTGRASASVTFSHYAPMQESFANKLLEKRKGFML